MTKYLTRVLIVLMAASVFSCSQETACPGVGSYSMAPAARIVHRSGRIKPRESMILGGRHNGRKPPKRNY